MFVDPWVHTNVIETICAIRVFVRARIGLTNSIAHIRTLHIRETNGPTGHMIANSGYSENCNDNYYLRECRKLII